MQSPGTVTLMALLVSAPLFAQSPYALERLDTPVSAVESARPKPEAAGTVSAETLRHPLKEAVRSKIHKALRMADSGNHKAAIAQLKLLRAQHPAAEGYVSNILGVEYLHMEQYAEARECFERAIVLLPRDATNHADLALTFIGLNQLDRAEPELRRALELDPHLTTTRQLLDALLVSRDLRHAAAE